MRPRRFLASAVVLVALAMAACGGRHPKAAPAPLPSLPPPGVPPNATTAAPSAWPGALHDARHSSAVAPGVRGPQTGRVLWARRLEGSVTPGPVLGRDGTVYAASNAGKLHALDPTSGTDRWVFDGGGTYGNDLSTSPSVLADGTILWPGPGNTLFALDPRGQLLWRQQFGGFVLSPADRGDGRVYIMDMGGTLSALDVGPSRHALAWSKDLGSLSYGSPVISPDGAVITTVDAEVVAVIDTGDNAVVKWRWRAPATIEVSPGVGPDGTVVVGPNDDYEYGIAGNGVLKWRWRKGDWSYSSAVVTVDGLAYFGDHLGFLDVIEASSGREIQRLATIPKSEPHPGGVGVWTAPAVDGQGNVYFGTVVGHVYGFGADGHRLFDVDTAATVDSYPALGSDGTLYIGAADGMLYAFAGGMP